MVDCLRADPFVFLEPPRSDVVESFETKDKVDDWGLIPGLFDAVGGAR